MEAKPGPGVSLLATLAFAAITSLGSTVGHAQVVPGSPVVVGPEAQGQRAGFMNLDVHFDRSTFWPARGARPATGLAMRSGRSLQAPTRARSAARARSTTRTVTGAIVGGVGGFFVGGFLGAHIEGDRCNCDDPGVRGFLIGAPIGAAAGGILGAKFLF